MNYVHPLYDGAPRSQNFGDNPGGYNPAGGHTGIDFAVPLGTPVRAIASGFVEYEGWAEHDYSRNAWWIVPGAGVYIAIDHGDNRPDSIYGHLDSTVVNTGDRVVQGQVIGYTGTTGNSTGPHLHFETLPPGYDLNTSTYGRVNPDSYLTAKVTQCVVTSGDSMSSIAVQFGVGLDALISANPHVANPNIIHAGMVLNLPA